MNERVEPSAERVSITVKPSFAHPDILSIQDAMRQVLDFFELLTPDDTGEPSFVWNLKLASTNSPLTVEGEATSLTPGINVRPAALAQKKLVSDYFRSTLSGKKPRSVFEKTSRKAVFKRILSRNMNGIGTTVANLGGDDGSIVVTPTLAKTGIETLEREMNDFSLLLPHSRDREEIGSVEGTLVEVGTDYNQPAILIKDRRTGSEIWCRVSLELKRSISESASFEDVWEHRRVIIRGRIRYDADGAIMRVFADSVRRLTPRKMTLHDIKDLEFTGGLRSEAYLSRLRDGNLGE